MHLNAENTWLKDADNIDISAINIDALIYRNQAVEEYITKMGKLCVIATKGVGKTLLLKYKRYKMQEDSSVAVLIPYDSPLDTFDLTLSLSKSKQKLLGDRKIWEKIWKFSLSISSIVSYAYKMENVDFLKDLQREFKGKNIHLSMVGGIGQRIDDVADKIEKKHSIPKSLSNSLYPSELVKDIIGSSENAIREIIEEALVILPRYYKAIDLSIAIFIDRIDQALRNYPNKMWYESQIGLLEATFNLFRDKPHIKTYCSIRKEAYAAYKSELRKQVQDIVTLLNFEPSDLEEIFKKAIQVYEPSTIADDQSFFKKDPVQAFTCQKEINNRNSKIQEEPFRYIYRHTLGRPRDLMVIGEQIHRARWGTQHKIRNIEEALLISIVNETMSQEIEKAYLIEVDRFLNSIKGQRIKKLFRFINKNVLSLKDIAEACGKFNKNYDECNINKCASCNIKSHAFCELYNIGLLGIIEDDKHLGKKFQKFMKSSEITPPQTYKRGKDKSILGATDGWYLIHPGLDDFISKVNGDYQQIKGILIGDGYEWDEKYSNIMNIHINLENALNTTDEKKKKLYREIANELQEGIIQNNKNKLKNLEDKLKKITLSGTGDALAFLYHAKQVIGTILEAIPK